MHTLTKDTCQKVLSQTVDGLSVSDLLDLALGRDITTKLIQYKIPAIYIPILLGSRLAQLDPLELCYHIEMPQTEENSLKDRCILWEITDWKTSHRLFLRKKQESHDRVSAWDKRKRNISLLVKQLKAMMFIDPDDVSQDEFLILKANIIIDRPIEKLSEFCTKYQITLEQ